MDLHRRVRRKNKGLRDQLLLKITEHLIEEPYDLCFAKARRKMQPAFGDHDELLKIVKLATFQGILA